MQTLLTLILLIDSGLMITAILLQQKGSGLSGVFGGSSASYLARRGAEKFLTFFTVFTMVVFIVTALLMLILK